MYRPLLALPLGLSGWPLVAQLISLNFLSGLLSGLGLVVAAVIVALVAGLRHRLKSSPVLTAACALFVTGAMFCVTVAARGTGTAPVADADLTVVELNTVDTATSPAQLADLVRSAGADIVTLPEADEQTTRAAATLLAADGFGFQVFSMSTPAPSIAGVRDGQQQPW